jgi:hypothetical protein
MCVSVCVCESVVRVYRCACAQAHTQLLCVTTRAEGLVRVSTSAGSVAVPYSSAELLQPPIVRSVAPLVWDPSQPTEIVVEGERCARAWHALCFRVLRGMGPARGGEVGGGVGV